MEEPHLSLAGACGASSCLESGAWQVHVERPRAGGLEPHEGAVNQVSGSWSPRASGGCHVVRSPPASSTLALQTGMHSRGTCLHPSCTPRDASLSPFAQHVHAHTHTHLTYTHTASHTLKPS